MSFSWADLPTELLSMIGKCLQTRIDSCRFRSVCASWRSSTQPLQIPPPHLFQQDLIIPFSIDGIKPFCFWVFKLTVKTIYFIEPPKHSTSPVNPWLIVVEEFEDGKLRPANLFSGSRIDPIPPILPRKLDFYDFQVTELQKLYQLRLARSINSHKCYGNLRSLGETDIRVLKAVFLSNPADDEFLLAVLQDIGKLSLFKFRTNEWMLLKNIDNISQFVDIANYKGKVYAININGQVIIVDSSLNVTEIGAISFPEDMVCKPHLVDLSGDLFSIDMRFFDFDFLNLSYETSLSFKVFKLQEDEYSWIEVKNLCDHAMLICNDQERDVLNLMVGEELPPWWCFSVSPLHVSGILRNCIILMEAKDGYLGVGPDDYKVGEFLVFNVETGAKGHLSEFPGYADMFSPPPNWYSGNS